MRNLMTDPERLWGTLMETAAIGGTAKGGICRLTLTDLDRQVRDWFKAARRGAGLHGHHRRHGRDVRAARGPAARRAADRDRQPSRHPADRRQIRRRARRAGRARGAAHTCTEAGYETYAPIEVVNWTNEEGSRFAPAMVASGVFAGVFDARLGAQPRPDRDGVTFGEALDAIGYRGTAALRRPPAVGVLRAAYRAGADPGGGGQRHRRRHRRAGRCAGTR